MAGANLPGEESVSERLAGDDAYAGAVGGGEDLVDPLLSEQAEGNLEDLGFPRFQAQRRFHGLVDRNAVTDDLALRLQRLEDFVRGGIRHRLRGRVVQLVEVHMVRPQALERPLEGERDVSGIEIRADSPMVEIAAHLRGEVHLIPASLQGLAEDLLAVPPSVHVRGIEEVHAEVDRLLYRGDRLPVVRRAVGIPMGVPADRPGPESDFRDLEAGLPERPSLHSASERSRL